MSARTRLGEALRYLREVRCECGDQGEFGSKLSAGSSEISRPVISYYENGKRIPSFDRLTLYIETAGLSPREARHYRGLRLAAVREQKQETKQAKNKVTDNSADDQPGSGELRSDGTQLVANVRAILHQKRISVERFIHGLTAQQNATETLDTLPAESIKRISDLLLGIRSEIPTRHIDDALVEGFSRQLETPFNELARGIDFVNGAAVWDPMIHPERACPLVTAILRHEANADALIGWGEFLPCSLETPEFMEAHHAAIFRPHSKLPSSLERAKFVAEAFNEIGRRQQQRFVEDRQSRPRRFVHIIHRSNLEKIAQGTSQYASIDRSVREQCLKNLIKLITDDRWGVELFIATDDRVDQLVEFNDLDSLVLVGGLAFWRDHQGNVQWSEIPERVSVVKELLDEFMRLSDYNDRNKVAGLLKELLR